MSPNNAARTTYHIRYGRASDNELLAEVGAETFSDSFAAQNTAENMTAYISASFSPKIQARELADPNTKFLIAEMDGKIVGYARMKFEVAPACIMGKKPVEIVRIYARKPWIGKGVGSALMQACLQEAVNSGCDVIWLDVWDQNDRAIEFYHRWGFVEAGSQTFQLGDDLQNDLLLARAVVMDRSEGSDDT